jgi:hypothetical protein
VLVVRCLIPKVMLRVLKESGVQVADGTRSDKEREERDGYEFSRIRAVVRVQLIPARRGHVIYIVIRCSDCRYPRFWTPRYMPTPRGCIVDKWLLSINIAFGSRYTPDSNHVSILCPAAV